MHTRLDSLDSDTFHHWIWDELRPHALEALIRPDVFQRAMTNVALLPVVLERQASQKEFNLPVWEYLAIAASQERVRNGRQMLRKHRELFNTIEQAFGVEPETIAAVWGLESGYGVVMGDTPVIPALATLAYAGRRASFFEMELIAALRLVQVGKLRADRMVGSWAGALGHGQFMPSSLIDFGVDLDGDGATDVCLPDPTDALASVANYLKKHGWRKGQPWAEKVTLPDGFDYALSGLDLTRPTRDWADMGVTTLYGGPPPDYGATSILLPAGAKGPALMTTRNFHVILRYNKAVSYAMGIGLLSDRLGGARSCVVTWPTDDRELSSGDISEAQYLLSRAGFDTDGIDGMVGPDTTRALRAFQKAHGLVADGYLGTEMLKALRRLRG